MKKKKMIRNAGMCMLLVGIFALSSGKAYASGVFEIVDPTQVTHNEVKVDPLTGEPVEEAEITSESIARLGSNVYYDMALDGFVYTLGTDAETTIFTTAVDGMITNEPVSITCGTGVTARIFRNGKEVSQESQTTIYEPGRYVLLLNYSTQQKETTLRFQIIDQYTNILSYEMPEGFTITEAYWQGIAVDHSSRQIVFEQEGEYQVYYTCESSGVNYYLRGNVDHTAPTLKLEAVNEEGIASSAVDLSDLEPGAVIYADLNGERIRAGNVLTQPGRYVLTVADNAGNASIYSFVIRMYFTISTVFFLILLFLVLGGLVAYVVISRKNLKVR